jgi:hypothetical protein
MSLGVMPELTKGARTNQTKPGGKMFSYVPGMMDIHVMPASADMIK